MDELEAVELPEMGAGLEGFAEKGGGLEGGLHVEYCVRRKSSIVRVKMRDVMRKGSKGGWKNIKFPILRCC